MRTLTFTTVEDGAHQTGAKVTGWVHGEGGLRSEDSGQTDHGEEDGQGNETAGHAVVVLVGDGKDRKDKDRCCNELEARGWMSVG